MNGNNNIAVGIVLYNPDISRLKKCINSLKYQVNKIYIYDNSNCETAIENDEITYITKNKNMGIAYALNQIMKKAKEEGFQWVVTMDQDSIVPEGMIEGFAKCIKQHPEIGIVCPQVIDKRRIYSVAQENEKEKYVEFCITSASCTAISAWEKCGKFDEWLFIDLVDNDFCKRITLCGYKILRLNEWILDQEFGKIIPKSRKKQEIWYKISLILHNENFAKFSYKKIVSPVRVYYTNRNIIYINKKFKKYGSVGYENYNCKGYIGFIICFLIPSILRSQNKIQTIKATIKGIKDGRESRPDEWSI